MIDKVKEEVEILESIFDGEGIVLAHPAACEVEGELSTHSSGKSNDGEEQQAS